MCRDLCLPDERLQEGPRPRCQGQTSCPTCPPWGDRRARPLGAIQGKDRQTPGGRPSPNTCLFSRRKLTALCYKTLGGEEQKTSVLGFEVSLKLTSEGHRRRATPGCSLEALGGPPAAVTGRAGTGEVDRLFTGSLPTPNLGEPGAHPSITCPTRDPQAQMAHSPHRAAQEGPAGQVGTQAEPTPICAGSRTPAPMSTSARGSVEPFQLVSHMGNRTHPSSWAFVTCQLVARPPSPTPESPAPGAPRDMISGIRDSGLAGGWGGLGSEGGAGAQPPAPCTPPGSQGRPRGPGWPFLTAVSGEGGRVRGS